MQIHINFELDDETLKEFGIDVDSGAKQELKTMLLEALEDYLDAYRDNDRYFGEKSYLHRRRYALVKAVLDPFGEKE